MYKNRNEKFGNGLTPILSTERVKFFFISISVSFREDFNKGITVCDKQVTQRYFSKYIFRDCPVKLTLIKNVVNM